MANRTNQKTPGFGSISIFVILLFLAVVYNFGCTDAKRNRVITNIPNKAAVNSSAARQTKPTSGRAEDSFIYRQIISLEFGHKMLTESMMFFVREAPDCKDIPAGQRTQDREIVFGMSILKELAALLKSHWDLQKGQFRLTGKSGVQTTKLEFSKTQDGKIRDLTVHRSAGGVNQVVARIAVNSPTATRLELNHQAFLSSYEVALASGQLMICDLDTDTSSSTERIRCQNLGQSYRVGHNVESIILPLMEYTKSGDPILSGSGAQYRNGRPLCEGDKAIAFAAPKNQTYITLFLNHERDSAREVETSKPTVIEPVAPKPAALPPGRRPVVKAGLDGGAATADSEAADAALNGLGQTSPVSGRGESSPIGGFSETSPVNGVGEALPVSTILDSPGAIEALKIQAIHDKEDSEPPPGAVIFKDPNDLNGVDPR